MITYAEFGAERIGEVLNLYRLAGWTAYLDDDERLVRAFDQSLWIHGAFDGGKLIGFIRCVGDGAHIIYVQDLIVHERYQRQGIGRSLLKCGMERFADVRMFTLATDVNDERANQFYCAMGLSTYESHSVIGYLR